MDITLERFNEVMDALEAGTVRVAEKVDGVWRVNTWVKEVILAGFKLGVIQDMSQGQFSFCDKNTFPVRQFTPDDGVRIVPGGSSIRRGAYLAPGSIVMPPAYVNVGAWVGEGTMVDSHATIGSCAQVGRGIHISAASQIGGVLEPAGAPGGNEGAEAVLDLGEPDDFAAVEVADGVHVVDAHLRIVARVDGLILPCDVVAIDFPLRVTAG